MNTFLPYPNIVQSVQCLDWRRLGKQRVEAKQILKGLTQGPKIAYRWKWVSGQGRRKELLWFQPLDSGEGIRNTPWYNHPATQMWKGYEPVLEYYMNCCIKEWVNRGFNNTMQLCVLGNNLDIPLNNEFPDWWGGRIHLTHKSNLLRKDPEWYGQFNWNISDNFEYFWPV